MLRLFCNESLLTIDFVELEMVIVDTVAVGRNNNTNVENSMDRPLESNGDRCVRVLIHCLRCPVLSLSIVLLFVSLFPSLLVHTYYRVFSFPTCSLSLSLALSLSIRHLMNASGYHHCPHLSLLCRPVSHRVLSA